ncbi:MAG: hypothetical protein K6C10_12545 [Prevotella sp.]|nr:hypothetical protein [Prevotella sp.]
MLIPKLKISHVLRAEEVPQVLMMHGVKYADVDILNWPEDYPYQPHVKVALAHTGGELLIHYRVEEECIRAKAAEDGGSVWEDSCCELFLQPKEGGPYYNMECNCGGTLLVAAGEDRHDRRKAPAEVTKAVSRWSSLGKSPIEMAEGQFEWQMALVVPVSTLFESDVKDFTGQVMRGNIYKCGDCLAVPHFLSRFPIITPSPDFHQPEFFQTMEFME